ncbi:MAG: plasmid partitioning protein RepB C-terminal domain-containing protein [Methylocystis sp.]|uniref:plasmid partitioning protein RepB C-terminal domain-containing protein n=1 Tax=Methylocystis sp. TaxID=1911079 RepID=UPI003DA62BBC
MGSVSGCGRKCTLRVLVQAGWNTGGILRSSNNYSASYAAALLAATPSGQLLDQTREQKFRGVTADQMARMEHEMSMVQSRFKAVEQDYGTCVLNMVVARGISKLLENDAVVRFLRSNYPDFLKEFRAIIDTGSLDERMNKGLTN